MLSQSVTVTIMATGGTARASVKGSDEYYPFMCSSCTRKEIDVGAEVYCIQCEEYLCGRCLSNHNSFTKMAAHTMLDRAQMEAKGPQLPQPLPTVQPLLTIPCDLHPGERYTLFCEKHNQVCCAVCSRIHHKSCDVRYILDVTKGTKQGPELSEFRRAMKTIMKNLETVKKQRELDMQRMTAEKDTEISKIRTSIQQMIKQLEELEKSAINDVSRKFTEFKIKIESDLTELGTMINTFNTKIEKLEMANDNTEKFVHMKICEEDKSSAKTLIADIKAREGEEKLVFLIDWRVEESIRKLQSLGELVLDYRYAVTPEGQHRVDTKKDKTVCRISSVCLVKDGHLLLTDWNNKRLKRLDQNYMIIDRLKLDDKPQGVCSISASQIAVCLCFSKTVQLVDLNPAMSKSRSFKTADRCRGIAYHADHLYVACGGWREDGEGPGHISMYTISGTLVRKLETDTQGQLFSSILLGVAVRSSDDVILVCDRDNALVALRQNGQRLWTTTCKDLGMVTVGYISLDSHDQAFVNSGRSNKVVLVSRDGRMLGAVLTARDGINSPQNVCFDTQRSRIILGMFDNNQISVSKLA